MDDIDPKARKITILALLIVLMLGALDQTIVSTAMPRIVSQLRGLSLYAWVTTIYLLTSTVMVPIWGKLGDLFGRKKILICGISIFMTGSALCGLAGEFENLPVIGAGMPQLIVFRGIQGVGGGALFTSAFAVIADLYPPRERSKMSGYFGAVFGLSSVLGPLIGGFFAEHGTVTLGGATIAGWRWVFYVNLPLSLLAIFMIATKAPGMTAGKRGKIDVAGALLIIAAFVPLLLALSWGGHSYAWRSQQILSLFAVTAVSLVLFVIVELRVAEPVLPLDLFANKVFSFCNAAAFILSMAFFGAVVFLPLFLQLGLGVSATTSGLAMLPMTLGLLSAAATGGRLATKYGRYKPILLFGGAMIIVSLFLLTGLGPNTSVYSVSWRVFLLGLGLGPSQGLFAIVMQNAAPANRIGVVTSANQFFRQIGSTVGVAVFGAVMTQSLSGHSINGTRLSLDGLQSLALAAAQRSSVPIFEVGNHQLKLALAGAIVDLFWVGLGFAVLGFLLITRIPDMPLRSKYHPEPVAEPGEGVGMDDRAPSSSPIRI